MPKYALDIIPICVECDTEEKLNVCVKCRVQYCVHFASKTDVRFCANCLGDFSTVETVVEKRVDHIRTDGTVSFSRKYQARCIHMQGNDWLFTQTLIPDMSDAEVDANVEYHRNIVSLMLLERESRKLERYQKLASVKIGIQKHESQEQREKREARETSKRTRTRANEKAPTLDDAVNMITKLSKMGLSQEQIKAMLGGIK